MATYPPSYPFSCIALSCYRYTHCTLCCSQIDTQGGVVACKAGTLPILPVLSHLELCRPAVATTLFCPSVYLAEASSLSLLYNIM